MTRPDQRAYRGGVQLKLNAQNACIERLTLVSRKSS
jgi:hypothetical protein